jgi:hypothetical protein
MSEGKLPLELRLGLRPGSVFYFHARELSSPEPHFFVVINRDPLGQALLLMMVFTSKVDKVRLRNAERPETVVEFGPGDYPVLDRPTAVDGNVVFRRSVTEMAELVRQRNVGFHPDVSGELLARFRAAVVASPVVDEDDKELIR